MRWGMIERWGVMASGRQRYKAIGRDWKRCGVIVSGGE